MYISIIMQTIGNAAILNTTCIYWSDLLRLLEAAGFGFNGNINGNSNVGGVNGNDNGNGNKGGVNGNNNGNNNAGGVNGNGNGNYNSKGMLGKQLLFLLLWQ